MHTDRLSTKEQRQKNIKNRFIKRENKFHRIFYQPEVKIYHKYKILDG